MVQKRNTRSLDEKPKNRVYSAVMKSDLAHLERYLQVPVIAHVFIIPEVVSVPYATLEGFLSGKN